MEDCKSSVKRFHRLSGFSSPFAVHARDDLVHLYQKEVTKETGQSFAKCADLEQFLRRMNEHEWAMLRYHMDRHAIRKLRVPLGGSPLSMLMGSCCRRSR